MDLSNIPGTGAGIIHFEEELDPQKLGLDIGIMHFESPLHVEGDISYGEEDLVLEARVEGVKKFACSRCLEPVTEPFEKHLTLDFETDRKSMINALPELSEELLVDSPIHALCDKECKGLCERCGANLNLGACRCIKD